MKITWAVGVTTVPQRADLLEQTLASLGAAGFVVRQFLDGAADGMDATARAPAIGPHGNWHLALLELFYRDRFADRFALFQDDVVAVAHLREFLDRTPYPQHGYWNLSTHRGNDHLGREHGPGWFEASGGGIGALGLVFDNAAARALLGSGGLLDYATDRRCPRRYPRYIDGGIATAMRAVGYSQFCHYPSLLQHTGIMSVIRSRTWEDALCPSFPGQGFDVRELLPASAAPA